MKLNFPGTILDEKGLTPLVYARFVFDLHQRQLTDVFDACEAAKDDRLVHDALREWAATSPELAEMPSDALATLCRTLATPRPAGGATRAQARDAALRSAAVALCQQFPDITPTRNVGSSGVSAAMILAEVVGTISEERMNKVLRGVGTS